MSDDYREPFLIRLFRDRADYRAALAQYEDGTLRNRDVVSGRDLSPAITDGLRKVVAEMDALLASTESGHP